MKNRLKKGQLVVIKSDKYGDDSGKYGHYIGSTKSDLTRFHHMVNPRFTPWFPYRPTYTRDIRNLRWYEYIHYYLKVLLVHHIKVRLYYLLKVIKP